jgi:MFS family permease
MRISGNSVDHHVEVRRNTLRTLSIAQIISGLGVAGAIPAGALLVLDISGSEGLAGLAQTFSVLGSALMAIPLANITQRGGRRAALATGYAIGALGALLTVLGGTSRIFPLVFLGILLVGAASASSYQARFAATDLAEDRHRGRDLSYVVWAGTVGSVLGPNLVGTTSSVAHSIGLPRLTGPYLVAGVMLLLGAIVIFIFLRPDPYLFSRVEAVGFENYSRIKDCVPRPFCHRRWAPRHGFDHGDDSRAHASLPGLAVDHRACHQRAHCWDVRVLTSDGMAFG